MNLYYDTEFTGLHQATTLISLAFVADDGQEFYAEFSDYDREQSDEWIEQNVLAQTRWLRADGEPEGNWCEGDLTLCHGKREGVRRALTEWLEQYDRITVWADCLAWDWVLLCELFGGAFGLPKQIHYMPMDLATLFHANGLDPDTDRAAFARLPADNNGEEQEHNALRDARLIMACHRKLTSAKNGS